MGHSRGKGGDPCGGHWGTVGGIEAPDSLLRGPQGGERAQPPVVKHWLLMPQDTQSGGGAGYSHSHCTTGETHLLREAESLACGGPAER